MNKKRLFTLLGVVLAIGILGAGFSLAATVSDQTPSAGSETASSADESADAPVKPEIARTDLNALAETLTDEQKAELAAIRDEMESLRTSMIDKLVEFGVLDQETADTIIANQAERYARMKEDGNVFGPGRGGLGAKGHGGRGPRGGRPPLPPLADGTAEAATAPAIEATDSN
ncbi:MAG: YckD family protein [Saccharofermentanales bacterium]